MGGLFNGISYNSIIWYNASGGGSTDFSGSTIENSCSPDTSYGFGNNFTNAPSFVDRFNSNFELRADSLCIDAGNHTYLDGATDLVGNARVVGVFIDVGAYESKDSDSDGLTDAEEAFYGTNPLEPDCDSDGIIDGDEVYEQGTDPDDSDSDDDGTIDGFELPIITAFIGELGTNGSAYGLFTSNAVLDLAVGDIGIEITEMNVNLALQMEQADQVGIWTNGDTKGEVLEALAHYCTYDKRKRPCFNEEIARIVGGATIS